MGEKKLYLSENDKKICGVCGGIAKYFDIDSTVIRLGMIVLMFLTAIIPVCLLYVVAAIIVPRSDEI